MKKSKYIVYADCVPCESNSRNARKHMEQMGARVVVVCKNNAEETEICRAMKHSGIILVGARKGV